MLEPASVALKFGFLAVLYLFLLWITRSVIKDLRRSTVADPQAVPPPPDATGLHSASTGLGARDGGGEPRLQVERAVGWAPGSAFHLSDEVVLGRGTAADIQLEDTFASARHARIASQGSVLVLEDLGSTNGTFLNDEPLRGPQPLHPGDRIRIGDTEFSFWELMMLRVAESFAKSDTGRQRQGNEDSLFARAPVFVVADGMGGAQAGEVASRMAVEAFEPGLPDAGNPEQQLAERAREANARIHDFALSDAERTGMGTTLTAAYAGPDEVSIAHVGDSRMYLWRDGELTRLTRDHSLVGEMVRQGKLTEEEAEEHPQRSIITRALGPEPDVEIETRTQPARPGDVFLLCSDGLTSMVSEREVAEILRSAPSLEAGGRALVDQANAAGGRDNITVVLFRLDDVHALRGSEVEQPTQAGEDAPTADEVRREMQAQAQAGTPAPTATATRPVSTAPPPARAPGGAPARRRRRPRPRWLVMVLATLTILVPVAIGGWIATRAVYFVGVADGQVAVFQGLPYDLPLGVHLYTTNYVSGVPASELPSRRRDRLLDHQLRSHDDATRLVRALELGQVEAG